MTALQKYRNPVITGLHPDPSICRVEDTFYLVASTFEYFPGIPVYESRDLVRWKCIGHCLTRREQLELKDCHLSGGIYAPSIRYWKGRFYVTATNVSHRGNFVVSASRPEGPWSDPVWLEAGGIDPSLYFEGERAYLTTNESRRGEKGIYLYEIDLDTGKCLGPERLISKGCVGRFPEAPHLYRIRGNYYLLLAEGGTEYGHMVTIQRSENLLGPYVSCPYNPIVSHRDMEDMRIMCTGHGDLTEDQNGNWWMVLLGVRTLTNETDMRMLHNLGRETFLAPVVWKDGWPLAGEAGRIKTEMEGPLPGGYPGCGTVCPEEKCVSTDTHFGPNGFSTEYIFLRNPDMDCYRFQEDGGLMLTGCGRRLSEEMGSPAMMAVRQKEFFSKCLLRLAPPYGEELCCGLTAFYSWEHHYDLCLARREGRLKLQLRKQIYDLEAVQRSVEIPDGEVTLEIHSDQEYYSFFAVDSAGKRHILGRGAAAALCTEVTRNMSFTSTLLGFFCEMGTVRIKDFKVWSGAEQWEQNEEEP